MKLRSRVINQQSSAAFFWKYLIKIQVKMLYHVKSIGGVLRRKADGSVVFRHIDMIVLEFQREGAAPHPHHCSNYWVVGSGLNCKRTSSTTEPLAHHGRRLLIAKQ